jgi:hypothetical protein
MTKPTGGLRDRRRRDVMELLARARPASLDPGQDPRRRAAEIGRLVAAGTALAETASDGTAAAGTAPAGSARAGSTRAGSTRAGSESAPLRPARRGPRAAVLAGTGLTAAAVAVVVLAASPGGTGAGPGGRTRGPVLLTAAMVHQVASASRSALARSGRATISYTSTQNGVPGDSSTDVITFSGKNWNDVTSQTSPGAGGRPRHTQTAINRIVNGQFYLYIAGRTRRLQWYHDTNRSGHPKVNIPDPRTVLRALEPSARFEVVGYQVIGGVRVRELRATELSHLPGQGKLVGAFASGGHVTSLEVWVDGRGVVHRLSLISEQINKIYPLSAENVRHRPHGPLIFTVPNRAMAAKLKGKLQRAHGAPRIIIRIAPPGSGAPRREVQVNRLTVTFSAIGQPQRITAPAHAIPVYGRG